MPKALKEVHKILTSEKKLLALLKRDDAIVRKKLVEKDINTMMKLIKQQEALETAEIKDIEKEMRAEENLIAEEKIKVKKAKGKKKKLEQEEIVYELHILNILYELLPLLGRKNELVDLQKSLLEAKHVGFTLKDLPALVKEEAEILETIELREAEVEELLKEVEKDVRLEERTPSARVMVRRKAKVA